MKKNQDGFGAIEGLLIVIVTVLIGFAGWYMWSTGRNTNKSSEVSTNTQPQSSAPSLSQTYTDSSKTYSFKYPKSWVVAEAPDHYIHYIEAALLNGNQTTLTPGDAFVENNNKNAVHIFVFKTDTLKEFADNATINSATPTKLKINGYDAIHWQQITKIMNSQTGLSGSYTENNYAVLHNNTVLLVNFKESQAYDKPSESDFDATKELPAYKAVVESIKFLN